MKYSIFLLLSVMFFACNQCKVKERELVYAPNTLTELKRNLNGNWLDTTQQQDNPGQPFFWNFDFFGSDYGRFQDKKIEGDRMLTPTDAPTFSISRASKSWWISFHYYFSPNSSEKLKIVKISNQRLVLSDSLTTKIYIKIP